MRTPRPSSSVLGVFADEVVKLVGQPVRVMWADWRRGCYLRGYLVLAGISPDSERVFFRGRSMAPRRADTAWLMTAAR